MNDLRDDAKRVMTQNFPQSSYIDKGFSGGKNDPWWKLW
jgi:outer membrane protein assembly factor BamD